MKTFDELTPEQQKKAVSRQTAAILDMLIKGFDVLNEDAMELVREAIAEAEGMQTPWFASEYILDAAGLAVEDEAKFMAEYCLYAEAGDKPIIVGVL